MSTSLKVGDRSLVLIQVREIEDLGNNSTEVHDDICQVWHLPLDDATVERLARAAFEGNRRFWDAWIGGNGLPYNTAPGWIKRQYQAQVRAIFAELTGNPPAPADALAREGGNV